MNLKSPTLQAIFSGLRGTKTTLTRPYAQLPVVYAAIKAKADNLAQVPIHVFRLDSEEPEERGPMVDLWEQINPNLTTAEFLQAHVTNLDAGGDFYVELDESRDREGVPAFMWLYPWHAVKPLRRNGVWTGWRITWGSVKKSVPRDGLIHGRYYNPYDDLLGLAPIEAIDKVAKIKFGALRFSELFFERDATPRVVYSTKEQLNEESIPRMEQRLFETSQGVENSHRSLLLDQGLTAQVLTPPLKDVQLLETFKVTNEEVLMAFKTPKTEVTLYEDVNYATALSQDRAFWTKTLQPLGQAILACHNAWMRPLGYRVAFDWSAVDALNFAFLERLESAEKLYGLGVPLNAINERLDLGLPEFDWGDRPSHELRPAAQFPMQAVKDAKREPRNVTPPQQQLTDDTLPTPERLEQLTQAARSAEWRRLDAPLPRLNAQAKSAIRKYFAETQSKLNSRLAREQALATQASASEYIAELLSAISDQRLRSLITPVIEDGFRVGAESFTDNFPLDDPDVRALIDERVTQVTQINETLRADLRTAINGAVAEGAPEAQVTEAVSDAMNSVMVTSRSRARTIARTEVNGAYSVARYEAMSQASPPRKRWISSRDSKVRDSHARLDGMTVPFAEAFGNGMNGPHDPNGPAGERINCRCKLVAVFDEEG